MPTASSGRRNNLNHSLNSIGGLGGNAHRGLHGYTYKIGDGPREAGPAPVDAFSIEEFPARQVSSYRTPCVNFGQQLRRHNNRDFFDVGTALDAPAPSQYKVPEITTVSKAAAAPSFSFSLVPGPRSCSEIKASAAFPRPISAPPTRGDRDFVRENIAVAGGFREQKDHTAAAHRAVMADRLYNVRTKKSRKAEAAARQRLLRAKQHEIREAEERKAAFLADQAQGQRLWLGLVVAPQFMGAMQKIMQDQTEYKAKAEQRAKAFGVLTRLVIAIKFKKSILKHSKALRVIRRNARSSAELRILYRRSSAVRLLVKFFKDNAQSALLRQRIVRFNKSVKVVQAFWRKVRLTLRARGMLLAMQWSRFEKAARVALQHQREEMEFEMIDQWKRPLCYEGHQKISIEDLPVMPPRIAARTRAIVLTEGIRQRTQAFLRDREQFQQEVIKQYYSAGFPKKDIKTYSQIAKENFQPIGAVHPHLRLVASQEELSALFARAVEIELTKNKRLRTAKTNRAFGEEREYKSFAKLSRALAAQHQLEVSSGTAPAPSAVLQEPVEDPPGLAPPEATLSIKTPRSYFKSYATFAEMEHQSSKDGKNTAPNQTTD